MLLSVVGREEEEGGGDGREKIVATVASLCGRFDILVRSSGLSVIFAITIIKILIIASS